MGGVADQGSGAGDWGVTMGDHGGGGGGVVGVKAGVGGAVTGVCSGGVESSAIGLNSSELIVDLSLDLQ